MANEPDMTVVGECALGPKTVALIEQTHPDVALLDGDLNHPLLLAMAETLAAAGSPVRKVHEGFRYASPEVASILVEQVISGNPGPSQSPRPFRLPRRKLEVLRLVAAGMNTKEVAHHLGIATKTADAHRRDLMDQLQLRTVADLTRFAIRNGLAEL